MIVEPSGKRYDSIEKEDMLLEAGSMIIMPHGEKTVFVTGEVRNQALYPFQISKKSLSVEQLLSQAVLVKRQDLSRFL